MHFMNDVMHVAGTRMTSSLMMMDHFLDESIGDNFKLLPDLLRSLERQRDCLQDQVSKS